MSTAHRPTWKPAVGRSDGGGWNAGGASSARKSTLDLAAHTKLKLRHGPQVIDRHSALRDSILKLEEAEKKAPKLGRRPLDPVTEEEGRIKLLKQTAEVDEERIRSKYKDDFVDDDAKEDDAWSDLDGDDSDTDDSDESDEDDEAALQAELEKIRAEREAAKRKEEEEANVMKEKEIEEEAMVGNPLLGMETKSSKLKRKWNDDVVFRNQARGEPEVQKRFINDTIRNDFHKRFLNKFIR